MKEITKEFTEKIYQDYKDNVKFRVMEDSITHNGLIESLKTRQSTIDNNYVFSIDVTDDKVSNQKASGRCWVFAALNTFKHKIISDFKLEDFELSQAHTFFWDKYEKAN